MEVCTNKFAVRDASEQQLVDQVVAKTTELVNRFNLPINKIRFGRQVKSYGSRGVAAWNLYTYKKSDKVELWINGHNFNKDESNIDRVIIKAANYVVNGKIGSKMDEVDKLAFKLFCGSGATSIKTPIVPVPKPFVPVDITILATPTSITVLPKAQPKIKIGQVITSLIINNPTLKNKEVFELFKSQYPNNKTTVACVAWYRNNVNRNPKLV